MISAQKSKTLGQRSSPWPEVILVFLLFFVLAGTPAPNVNEVHYLTKAKHFWDRDWCARDLFLASADSHFVFYATCGVLTKFCSLSATAWWCRFAGWGMLACGWTYFARGVVQQRGVALLSAAIVATLWSMTTMAGEWVVGGAESKGFAYAFVFASLGATVRGRPAASILWMALAVAFHPLVGGWAGMALCAAMWRRNYGHDSHASKRTILTALLLGSAIAMTGILPALGLGSGTAAPPEPTTVLKPSATIHVYDRLSHHQVFHSMKPALIARFTLLVLLWVACSHRGLPHPLNVVDRFAIASMAFVMGGILLDRLGVYAPDAAASLLKFYWFRLADVAVPMVVTMIICHTLFRWRRNEDTRYPSALVVVVLMVTAFTCWAFGEHRQERRPRADIQGRMITKSAPEAWNWFEDWQDVCRWAAENTPTNALFLTPTHSQTFKWYAERAEYATWKDAPQDDASLQAWNHRLQRIRETYFYQGRLPVNKLALAALVEEFKMDYVVVVHEFGRPLPAWSRVYGNPSFSIHKIPATAPSNDAS